MTDVLRTGVVEGLSPATATQPLPAVTVYVDGTHVPGVGYNTDTYSPQVGDTVIIAKLTDQLWVLQCMTPGRGGAASIFVANSAPGAGWSSIASTYVQSGVTANPDVTLVLTSAVIPPTTLVVPASNSGQYQSTSPARWGTSHRVVQGGLAAGSTQLNFTGAWFYPSLATALTGLTITRVQLTVAVSSEGRSPVQLHLYEHNYASPPGGAPTLTGPTYSPAGAKVVLGSTVTFDLPLAWAADFKAGTQKGVAISSASVSEFVELLGVDESSVSGTLTFTH